MARAVRSNPRTDLIILVTCLVLALAARALPNAMRDPVSTTMRRTFLAPLVVLQQRAELSRRAMLLVDEKTANTDTLTLKALRVTAVEAENDLSLIHI